MTRERCSVCDESGLVAGWIADADWSPVGGAPWPVCAACAHATGASLQDRATVRRIMARRRLADAYGPLVTT